MSDLFRFNDTLVDAILNQDRDVANEVERRLEQWLEYPTLNTALFANGSVSAPSISFSNDSNTGFYITGDNGEILFAANGTKTMELWAGGLQLTNGDATNPAYSFFNDDNVGMYRIGADLLGFATNGTERVRIGNAVVAFSQSILTGATSYVREPWSNATISLGNLGSVGTQGSFATGIYWNWDRGTDSGYYSLGVNSWTSAGTVEIGNDGVRFAFDSSYGATTIPTLRMKMDATALFPNADGGIDLGKAALAWGDLYVERIHFQNGIDTIVFSNDDELTYDDTNNYYNFGKDGGLDNATLRAAAFSVTSGRATKTNIRPATPGALTRLRGVQVKEYTDIGGTNTKGIIAEEAPAFVRLQPEVWQREREGEARASVTRDEGVNLYAYIAEVHQALIELADAAGV